MTQHSDGKEDYVSHQRHLSGFFVSGQERQERLD